MNESNLLQLSYEDIPFGAVGVLHRKGRLAHTFLVIGKEDGLLVVEEKGQRRKRAVLYKKRRMDELSLVGFSVEICEQ